MQPKTREDVEACRFANPAAILAFRAIMREVERIGWPQAYLADLALDADRCYEHEPAEFVYALRHSGTDLYLPGESETLEAHYRVFGGQARYYRYDQDALPDAQAREPELSLCSYEEARAFLAEIEGRREEARFLTPEELQAIAEELEGDLAAYVREDHPAARGRCRDLRLTRSEAARVDECIERLGIR